MTRRLSLISAFLCLSLGVASAAAPPRTPLPRVLAELSGVRAIQAVAVSPDGRYLAWSADAGAHPRITIAPVAHPHATVTIAACAACDDADFAWSPTGASIAYVETGADGQGQLAVARADGGGAHRITKTLRGPVNSPKWSPDGSSLAVLYAPGAPKAPSPLFPSTPDAGVVGSTYFEQRIAVVPASGAGRARLVSPADLNIYEYDWSPDGRRFAVSAAHGDGDAQWWVAALYTVDTRTGATTKIAAPPTQIASPRFSGDGKTIAYIGGLMSDESITGGDVYTVPASGGTPVDLTAGRTASIVSLAWNGSSQTLLLTELAGGSMRIVRFDLATETGSILWSAEESIFANSLYGFLPGDVGVSLSRDGRVSAVIRQSFVRPPEIYAGPIGAWRAVTTLNAHAPHVVTRARSITWKSDDFTVQGWLLYPAGYTPSRHYPMVTVVHGGPAFAVYPAYPSSPLAYDAVLASQGYVVFEPNARGSYGQGEAFTRGNVKDFGGGDLRDILAGVKAAEAVAPVDDARVGIFGWSYGGYMTMWALTQTTRFRAAVSGAGLSDWLSYYGTNGIDTWMTPFFGASVYDDPAVYAKSSPMTFITHVKTPTLMVGGDRDAEVPITQSYEYAHALKDLGVPSEFVVYPGEGHLFLKPADQVDVATRLVGWFDRWMPAAP
jgi:dipeptidyl aminopeptidase/acylaminoacyl peptidase